MMLLKRAIIFGLDTIIHPEVTDDGTYTWSFDPRLPGLLRDCHATGHLVFGLLDPLTFGLALDGPDEAHALTQYINNALCLRGGTPLDAIHISPTLDDPRPLWAWKRRFGFSLASTTLVGYGDAYERLRRNAGLSGRHLEPRTHGDLFQHSAHMLGL